MFTRGEYSLKILRIVRNYICYCGIEKEEFYSIRKDTYISNYKVWRILHWLMTVFFAVLYIDTLVEGTLLENRLFYLIAFVYSAIVTFIFSKINKKSILIQVLIYTSIAFLFLFSSFITQNKPDVPAATFFVMLIVTPMFVIDKPYYTGIVLTLAFIMFSVWMYFAKPPEIWEYDFSNAIIFYILALVLHIIANSVRIREFVLTRKINIQKDTDDMTGLKNKGALTRAINKHLNDDTKDKGILFVLDIDQFKTINDTYGHDIGDDVIIQLGNYLSECFVNDEIVGRFGGDEFIVFLRNINDVQTAKSVAERIITGAFERITLPDKDKKVGVSIGIAIYSGAEKNYSEIFKKADLALYKVKADPEISFMVFE